MEFDMNINVIRRGSCIIWTKLTSHFFAYFDHTAISLHPQFNSPLFKITIMVIKL